MDLSGDLSGFLEDDFWTRRHAELQQRIHHIESLKQSLLHQLRERQDTLETIQADDELERELVPNGIMISAALPPSSSSRPGAFDLSTIIEGDTISDSKLDSFHGLPTSVDSFHGLPTSTVHHDKLKSSILQNSSLLETWENWKSLASETVTSLETGKLSR